MHPFIEKLSNVTLFETSKREYTARFSLPLILCMAFLAPFLPVFLLKSMAPLFIVGAILTSIVWMFENRVLPVFSRFFAAFIGGFLVLCAASIFWSINMEASFDKFLKMLLFFASLLMFASILQTLKPAQYKAILRNLTFGLFIAVVVYMFESKTGFPIFYTFYHGGLRPYDVIQNKTLYMFFLFLIPVCYYCWARRDVKYYVMIGLFLLVTIPVLIWISSNTSMRLISGMIGFSALLAFYMNARVMRYLVFIGIVFTCLTAPMFAQSLRSLDGIMESDIANSFKSRIEIWDMTARRTYESPLIGWGLKSSPYMPNRDEISVLYVEETPIAHLHPHNGVLQIWFEFGLLGITFLIGLCALIIKKISHLKEPVLQNVCVLGLMAAFMMILPSFGIWQTWFMATLSFFACMLMSVIGAFSVHEEDLATIDKKRTEI